MTYLVQLRIVIASPDGVKQEREALIKVIDKVNRHTAARLGLILKAVQWETDSYPGFHVDGPQGLIDSVLNIEGCDILIGIFWKRFGTPTKNDGMTGTEHEFYKAHEAWKRNEKPHIMLYFNQKPYFPKNISEVKQQEAVLKFKKNIPKEGLHWKYKGLVQFKELVEDHLTNYIQHKFETKPTVLKEQEQIEHTVEKRDANIKQLKKPWLPSIEKLLDRDPCISIPLANRLIKEGKIDFRHIFDNIVDNIPVSDFGVVNKYVFRILCRAFPQQSAPILVDLILNADEDWHGARNAVDCLTPYHVQFAEKELCKFLCEFLHIPKHHLDILSICIEGLGKLGTADCTYLITDTIIDRRLGQRRTAYYDKLYHFVSRALGYVFVYTDINDEYNRLWGNSSQLQQVLSFAMSQPEDKKRYPTTEIVIKEVLSKCTPDHVDVLIEHWLSSKEAIFRKIGAYALGKIRVSRAVPYLVKSLENRSEDIDVLDEISEALGYIGGNDAVTALLRHKQIKPIAYALGELEDFEIYDYSLQKLFQLLKNSDASNDLETQLLVYRAIGLKRDQRYINDLRQLLHASEPGKRAVAALALVRIRGLQELNTLRKAYEESGSPFERVLIELGLIELRSPEINKIIVRLRKDLTIDPCSFTRHFREDVISILRKTRKYEANLIADSWQPIYNTMIDDE